MELAASACSTCTAGRRLRSWGPVSSATHAATTCSEAQSIETDRQHHRSWTWRWSQAVRTKSAPAWGQLCLQTLRKCRAPPDPCRQAHPVCSCCCGGQLCQPGWAADESCQAACCYVGRARVVLGAAINQRQQAGWRQRLQQIFLLLRACRGKACVR